MKDVGIWFTVYMDEHRAALMVFQGKESLDFMRRSNVREIHDLNGKPCFIKSDNGIVQFIRFWGEEV